ncbi:MULTISPECIES: hypothetical protein [Microvirga]|uniref:hypothetical protein n=1 Tax=Microvirga TaxID=186650 RepID=UPI001FFC6451|nr:MULTISPECIES: hypothetical protein [unclassified Microvirga]
MRDLRNDRMRRAGVHEERLRATAGLRSSSTLSSWRGRSGRRYIVGVHPLNETELLDVTDAVILAVKRDSAGIGIVVDAAMAASDPSEQPRIRWLAKVRERGATELHIHRLAATEDDRRAIFEDLRENETQDC